MLVLTITINISYDQEIKNTTVKIQIYMRNNMTESDKVLVTTFIIKKATFAEKENVCPYIKHHKLIVIG